MKSLTGSKKVLAVTSAVFLIAAASGTALAMLDPGLGSISSKKIERQVVTGPKAVRPNASTGAQQSPLPTGTLTGMAEPQGNEIEFRGTVDVIAATGWVIGGQTVQVTGDTEVKAGVEVGSLVKVHAQRQADGSLWVREIELVQAGDDNENGNSNDNENENENENHNGNVNSNDDNGNDDHDGNGNVNSNDDNDDHDGNSNDDHGGNGNDDHGGNGND
jgi:hypothetical protein